MRDFLTFEAHVEGMARGSGRARVPAGVVRRTVLLFMAPHAVHGPYDEVAMPPDTERLDFELEIAAVICRDVRNVTPGESPRLRSAGICVMNDWSARDVQEREMTLGLGPSKGKDFATTIGPWIVTADALEPHSDDPGSSTSQMSVEVTASRSAPTGPAIWAGPSSELVSHASRASWVKAGEVLASGTCATGALAEAWGRTGTLEPPPLQIGDVVEMTVEGIGTISNRIVAARHQAPPIPHARARAKETQR